MTGRTKRKRVDLVTFTKEEAAMALRLLPRETPLDEIQLQPGSLAWSRLQNLRAKLHKIAGDS